jgi:two-component system chemotaxis response regulator CheB
MHLSTESQEEIIVRIFQKYTSLQCSVACDKDKIKRGHIYLAPSDYHMTVKDGHIRLMQGPHEHRFRPSIDVLFRTAAVSYGPRVIGIILTGMLDDGTGGMAAVKKCGGTCIVQEPADAEFKQMPLHVIHTIDVDYKVSIDEMGYVLDDLLSKDLPAAVPIPIELKKEYQMTERVLTSIDKIEEIGDRSEFICPDCGGGLWKLKNDPAHRYKCHVGHAYTEKNLLAFKMQDLEESVWVSIRMLEERLNLLNLMATHSSEAGYKASAETHKKRAREAEKHLQALKVIQTNLAGINDMPDENLNPAS